MKKISFYLLIAVSVVFTGCSLDEKNPEYYNVLGTIYRSNDSVLIISDDDDRLLVNNSGALTQIDENERLIAYFSLIEEPLPSGIDYVIDVVDFSKVLFKPVIELTEEIADSIGNDPVRVESIWLAKDYMNVKFQFYGSNAIHFINLTRAPGIIDSDTINLELRHNDNNDIQSYLKNGFVSFDLESLQSESADSVILRVKAKGYDSYYFDKAFVYRF
jgi:hypothetical protein